MPIKQSGFKDVWDGRALRGMIILESNLKRSVSVKNEPARPLSAREAMRDLLEVNEAL